MLADSFHYILSKFKKYTNLLALLWQFDPPSTNNLSSKSFNPKSELPFGSFVALNTAFLFLKLKHSTTSGYSFLIGSHPPIMKSIFWSCAMARWQLLGIAMCFFSTIALLISMISSRESFLNFSVDPPESTIPASIQFCQVAFPLTASISIIWEIKAFQ